METSKAVLPGTAPDTRLSSPDDRDYETAWSKYNNFSVHNDNLDTKMSQQDNADGDCNNQFRGDILQRHKKIDLEKKRKNDVGDSIETPSMKKSKDDIHKKTSSIPTIQTNQKVEIPILENFSCNKHCICQSVLKAHNHFLIREVEILRIENDELKKMKAKWERQLENFNREKEEQLKSLVSDVKQIKEKLNSGKCVIRDRSQQQMKSMKLALLKLPSDEEMPDIADDEVYCGQGIFVKKCDLLEVANTKSLQGKVNLLCDLFWPENVWNWTLKPKNHTQNKINEIHKEAMTYILNILEWIEPNQELVTTSQVGDKIRHTTCNARIKYAESQVLGRIDFTALNLQQNSTGYTNGDSLERRRIKKEILEKVSKPNETRHDSDSLISDRDEEEMEVSDISGGRWDEENNLGIKSENVEGDSEVQREHILFKQEFESVGSPSDDDTDPAGPDEEDDVPNHSFKDRTDIVPDKRVAIRDRSQHRLKLMKLALLKLPPEEEMPEITMDEIYCGQGIFVKKSSLLDVANTKSLQRKVNILCDLFWPGNVHNWTLKPKNPTQNKINELHKQAMTNILNTLDWIEPDQLLVTSSQVGDKIRHTTSNARVNYAESQSPQKTNAPDHSSISKEHRPKKNAHHKKNLMNIRSDAESEERLRYNTDSITSDRDDETVNSDVTGENPEYEGDLLIKTKASAENSRKQGKPTRINEESRKGPSDDEDSNGEKNMQKNSNKSPSNRKCLILGLP